ncbi:monocarboxylate transporter 4-like [Dreissena polymorpha]|uniref:monocarboxylate transporter 4-like n=1 Tax=Dreissena polymorpha TaxID=45954 RepID=UPI002263F45A|nr:monocarboxylate transporter 4-like [Dreissena polymorpha]
MKMGMDNEVVPLLKKKDTHVNITANTEAQLLQKTGRVKKTKARQTAILGACMYMHLMSLGFTVALGVIYVELIRYFDTKRSLAATVQSLFQGLTFLGGIAFSPIVIRFGVGKCTMIASTCGALSLFISIWSVNIYMVIVCIGFFGGLCMSVNYLSAFVAVGWTFSGHRKAALAALTMATALGQIFLPNLIEALIEQYGWTGACMVASGLMLNSLPCGLILYFSKHTFQENVNNSSSSSLKVCTCSSKKDVAFIVFLIVCLIYPGWGAVESWFIVDLTVLRGYGRQAGTVLLSLLGIFGLLGRMMGTALLTVFPTLSMAVPLASVFQFFALGHFIVIYLETYNGMLVGCLIRGLSIGAIMCFQPSMLLELRGIDRFPRTVAICNCFTGIVQIISGYLGGTVADLTGGYDIAFYVATITAAVSGMCLIIVKCLINIGKKTNLQTE